MTGCSPACASRRGKRCDCEAGLREARSTVYCICGNQWRQPTMRDITVTVCSCPFPGEGAPDEDDSAPHGRHTYNVDRL